MVQPYLSEYPETASCYSPVAARRCRGGESHATRLNLAALPVGVAALGMMAVHAVIHVPVPSVSGDAVLTLPIMVPLSDLIGLSRQITVLSYQYGAGLCELVTPTNGGLMAILAAAHVRFEDWLRVIARLTLLVGALGAAAILAAIVMGLQ